MGNEANCTVRQSKKSFQGKALLETSEVIFRSPDLRVKIPFTAIKSAESKNGELILQTADDRTIFELGPLAEKWLQKILHPKSRMEKLGIKPGDSVYLVGDFPEDFLKELRSVAGHISEEKLDNKCASIFFAANSQEDLAKTSGVAKKMSGSTALWIVYPKGQKEITENRVLAAGRQTGLKDVKVVGFSPALTALKFVIPIAKR